MGVDSSSHRIDESWIEVQVIAMNPLGTFDGIASPISIDIDPGVLDPEPRSAMMTCGGVIKNEVSAMIAEWYVVLHFVRFQCCV
jgi:hypothetical protein